jgi:hypothetical protein
LLVVTDAEEVAMAVRQPPHDPILDWIEILELVHQDVIPPAAKLRRRARIRSEQPLSQRDQIVEVSEVAGAQRLLVAPEELRPAFTELSALELIQAEESQRPGASLCRYPEPP